MRHLLPALVALVLLPSCTAFVQQHRAPDPKVTTTEAEASKDSAEPDLVSRFADQSLAMKQVALLAQLDLYKQSLSSQGSYDCCVKPGCNECVLRAGECHCRRVVEKDGPCCGECTQAWIEGRGNIAGVDREEILEHLGCVWELYEKKVPEGETPPGQAAPKQ